MKPTLRILFSLVLAPLAALQAADSPVRKGETRAFVYFYEVYPTLCELAGTPVPAAWTPVETSKEQAKKPTTKKHQKRWL